MPCLDFPVKQQESENEQQPGAAAHVQPERASVPPAEISAPTVASIPTTDAPSAQLNRAPLTAGPPPDAKITGTIAV